MRIRPVATAALALVCGSCEPEKPTLEGLYPTIGKIVQEGKPPGSGGLLFLAESGGRAGCTFDAPVNADGTFEARTCRAAEVPAKFYPGLPVGTYRVIYNPATNGAISQLEMKAKETVTVGAAENVLSVELPDKSPPKNIPRDDDPNSPKFDPNRGG